jgi:hypothetical protein
MEITYQPLPVYPGRLTQLQASSFDTSSQRNSQLLFSGSFRDKKRSLLWGAVVGTYLTCVVASMLVCTAGEVIWGAVRPKLKRQNSASKSDK